MRAARVGRTGRWAAAFAAATMLVVALPAQAATYQRLYGSAFGPYEADTVHVALDVHGAGPAARGAFRIVHDTPTGLFAYLVGDVDCMEVVADVLVRVTGTIRSGFDGLGINPIGHRVSFVYGFGGLMRSVSLDVSFVSGHTIPPCAADPIVGFKIAGGQLILT